MLEALQGSIARRRDTTLGSAEEGQSQGERLIRACVATGFASRLSAGASSCCRSHPTRAGRPPRNSHGPGNCWCPSGQSAMCCWWKLRHRGQSRFWPADMPPTSEARVQRQDRGNQPALAQDRVGQRCQYHRRCRQSEPDHQVRLLSEVPAGPGTFRHNLATVFRPA